MKSVTIVFAVLLLAIAPASAEDKQREDTVNGHPSVALADILEVVAKNTRREILVDSRAPSKVVIGQASPRDIDYTTLLTILRNNGMAAVAVGDVTNVVPVNEIRQQPLPILHADDDTIGDEEWVTMVLTLEKAGPRQLVPILRPLLPQQGHLTANAPSRTLIIVDRYANVRRIVAIVREIDAKTTEMQE